MKKILIALLLISSLALPAADHHDISLSFGHSMYKWPEKGISFSYGVNIGLSARRACRVLSCIGRFRVIHACVWPTGRAAGCRVRRFDDAIR